ncbi:MAG TPA: hypothetical protein PKG77_16255 [Phycisphaerae bacterium]|nr:hypothetical protein [Phycisphaerae bacterium]HQL75122.1 hypothetical protein [Phycisphaerae bacterium]
MADNKQKPVPRPPAPPPNQDKTAGGEPPTIKTSSDGGSPSGKGKHNG